MTTCWILLLLLLLASSISSVQSANNAQHKIDFTNKPTTNRRKQQQHPFLPILSRKKVATTSSITTKSILDLRGGASSSPSPPTTSTIQSKYSPTKEIVKRGGGGNDGGTGGASVPNEIFNLVKSIVGAGVLGLPAGIAAFGTTKIALIPSIVLIAIIGTLSSYGFALIGRCCSYTGAHSYRDAWDKAVGSKTSWIPAAACFLVTSCSVLAYSMILSDTIPSLAQSFVGIELTRTQALLGVTVPILLPLCLMKSLKSLGPFSLVGIIGMIYTSCAMAYRFIDGSYREGGKFYDSLTIKPQFGLTTKTNLIDVMTNPSIFVLVSMLSTAFMAHYNAPKFYWELENNTLERYQLVVNVSFLISMLMFIAVASFGFGTFGTACTGLVLKNYSTNDPLMSLSRVAVLFSLLFSYPLAFVGVRDGILDLLQIQDRPDSLLNSVTVGLLTVITGLAYCLSDLRKLLAFNGATWGNAVIYLLPTYMFVQCSKNVKPELKSEVPLAITTGILGLAMGIVGTIKAVGS